MLKATTLPPADGGVTAALRERLLSSAGISDEKQKQVLSAEILHPGCDLLLAGVGVEGIRAATFKLRLLNERKGWAESTASGDQHREIAIPENTDPSILSCFLLSRS